MSRTAKIVAIATVVLVIAVVVWRHRDSRGVIVTQSESPDGRWRIRIYEHSPFWPMQSPFIYTYSLSSTRSAAPVGANFTHNNDSAKIDDFHVVWSASSATVSWGRNQWAARAAFEQQAIQWTEIK